MMLPNSELQKYYWQDFTLQRIIVMPLVIAGIALLLSMPNREYAWSTLHTMSSTGYYALVFLWGGYLAANAMVQEVKENTWDNLRLSSVKPGELAFGKLIGSTMYAWYGGLMVLAIYVVSGCLMQNGDVGRSIFGAYIMLGTGVLCHAIALVASLIPMRLSAGRNRVEQAGYFILALMISGSFLTWGNSLAGETYNLPKDAVWFGIHISAYLFCLISIFLALAWTLCGIHRLIRDALMFKNTPYVWGFFVIFAMVYCAGFGTQETTQPVEDWLITQALWSSAAFIAFMVGTACTYLSLFAENLNIIRYRTLIYHWEHENWKRLNHFIPMWVVSFGLTVLAGAALMMVAPMPIWDLSKVFVMIMTGLLFLLRDVGIIHFFTLKAGGRLPLLAALFYLALLYLLAPWILFAFGNSQEDVGFWFYPTYSFFTKTSLWMILPALAQVLIMAVLVKSRYRQAQIR